VTQGFQQSTNPISIASSALISASLRLCGEYMPRYTLAGDDFAIASTFSSNSKRAVRGLWFLVYQR
jgi:hypothetical protein